jgi:lysyl-tRNA synthetase class 2
VLVAATGWLYLARPVAPLPGPRLHDALALDELSKHGSVPLLLYLAVWGVAAALLGLLVRWAHTERLTAGLLLGPAVGAWLYALNGVSILVVRQIPADQAFRAAAAEQAMVIPAALAGIAGALAGRSRRSDTPRGRLLLACLVAAVAALGALDAILPQHRRSLVTALDPTQVHGLSKALAGPLAVALLVTARGLARGNRRAWQIACVLLALLLVLHILRRFDTGAVVTGIAVVALVARRADFPLRSDPASKPRVLVHLALAAGAVVAYGLVTLWVNRLMVDQPYTLPFALRVTGLALAGRSEHLSGAFGEWYPLSLVLFGTGAALLLLAEWLAPWRYRLRRESHELELARSLVEAWGADTLAPFALRADKSYFFSEDESAFLSYRVIGGIAIVAGDPIGPPQLRGPLVARFIEFAHEHGWRVAVLGASEPSLGVYAALGLRALYHGDEAVVGTQAFSLEGRRIRKVRQSVHRLEAAGFTACVLQPSEVDARLRDELEEIALKWRGDQPERGFVMAFDALFRHDDALFVVGFDSGGRACGFLHFAVCRASCALSLSSMPRLRDVPNGFNEWLICSAIAAARDRGFERVSLNFSPFAALLAPGSELHGVQRMEAATLRRLKGRFQLDNLLHFNRKFLPEWEPRFVVYERRLDLPRVGVAALAAESYLPFQ